jgi:hypothetical protein
LGQRGWTRTRWFSAYLYQADLLWDAHVHMYWQRTVDADAGDLLDNICPDVWQHWKT